MTLVKLAVPESYVVSDRTEVSEDVRTGGIGWFLVSKKKGLADFARMVSLFEGVGYKRYDIEVPSVQGVLIAGLEKWSQRGDTGRMESADVTLSYLKDTDKDDLEKIRSALRVAGLRKKDD